MRKILIAYWLSCILFFCSACQQNPGTPLAASSPSEPVLEQVAPSWQTHTDPVTLTLASDHHFSADDLEINSTVQCFVHSALLYIRHLAYFPLLSWIL